MLVVSGYILDSSEARTGSEDMEAADLPEGREDNLPQDIQVEVDLHCCILHWDNLLQDIQVEVDLQCCILQQDNLQPEDLGMAGEDQCTEVEAEVV